MPPGTPGWHKSLFLLHQSRKNSLEHAQDADEDQDRHTGYESTEGPSTERLVQVDVEETVDCSETGVVRKRKTNTSGTDSDRTQDR